MPLSNFVGFLLTAVAFTIGQSLADSIVHRSTTNSITDDPDLIHLAVVACGADRVEETMIMLKSALLFTKRKLHLHLFADDDARPQFSTKLEEWPEEYRAKYEYTIYKITYPPGDINWKKVFKPCATQRLFIPYIIDPAITRIVYVDTDILFLRSIDDLWAHFDHFNATHAAALSPEHETTWSGWYNRFARHPYYGLLGVNSGVMLMHCEKLRLGSWQDKMISYYKTYRYNITWGDQDLINIYFHYYPEMLYVYGCEWNYRADFCMYGSVCKAAETDGAMVLHGNRQYFHNDKQPAMKAVYQALRDYEFGRHMKVHLIQPLKTNLENTTSSYCGKVPQIFTKQLEKEVAKLLKQQKPTASAGGADNGASLDADDVSAPEELKQKQSGDKDDKASASTPPSATTDRTDL